jgi:hypothetical protein
MTEEDIIDLRSVLNEQFDYINRLMPLVYAANKDPKDFQTIYESIVDCNKVMMEIISGPNGKIEKMIDRTDKELRCYICCKTIDSYFYRYFC